MPLNQRFIETFRQEDITVNFGSTNTFSRTSKQMKLFENGGEGQTDQTQTKMLDSGALGQTNTMGSRKNLRSRNDLGTSGDQKTNPMKITGQVSKDNTQNNVEFDNGERTEIINPDGTVNMRETVQEGTDLLGKTGDGIMQTEVRTLDITAKQPLLHRELFGNDPTTNKIIVCENEFTDFGFCNALQVSGQREITINNVSGTKLTVSWTRNYTENSEIPIFSVSPQSANLRAGEAFTFTVNFRPTHRSAFFF